MEETTTQIATEVSNSLFSGAFSFNKKDAIEVGKFIVYTLIAYALANEAQIITFLSKYVSKEVIDSWIAVITYAYKRFKDANPS